MFDRWKQRVSNRVPDEWGTDFLTRSKITPVRRTEAEYARRVRICQSEITEAIVVKIRISWRR